MIIIIFPLVPDPLRLHKDCWAREALGKTGGPLRNVNIPLRAQSRTADCRQAIDRLHEEKFD
ncbi:hypothetical protein EYF80_030342 [Liparis tanakae]|uniref:Uncharacterized protein n=1 Tax=Liparis tanakae TaxID=230148 RepID=A0A4Z2H0N7_9TELE|nr:hypothetical protein EYF80_030342 [Liparis tanakae]